MSSENSMCSLDANFAELRRESTHQRTLLHSLQIGIRIIVGLTCMSCSQGLSGHMDPQVETPDTQDSDDDSAISPIETPCAFDPSGMSPLPSADVPAINSEQTSMVSESGTAQQSSPASVSAAPENDPNEMPDVKLEPHDDVDPEAPPDPPVDWADGCEQVHVLRAHGEPTAGDTSPYRVAAGAEEVRQFYFKTTRAASMHLLKTRAIRGNARVLHHWSLYLVHDVQLRDGELLWNSSVLDVLRRGELQFLVGGGRGSSDLTMPPGVGVQLPQGANVGYLFEAHYFNASDETQEDTSGVELCVTSQPVEHEAAAHLLGRVTFQVPRGPSDVTSTCTPVGLKEPVHVLGVTPHMHEMGTRAKIILNRSTNQKTTLLDQPFTPDEQPTYPVMNGDDSELIVNPGDTLTTTCSYTNTGNKVIYSGPDAENEMCLMLVWAWPAGILQNNRFISTEFPVAENLDCMDE